MSRDSPTGAPLGSAGSATCEGDTLAACAALEALELSPGAAVLITGPVSGVGRAAVVLAIRQRLEVFVVAGAEDHDLLTSLGATRFVSSAGAPAATLRGIRPLGVDAVLDAAGLRSAIVPAIRDGGRITALGGWQPQLERGVQAVPGASARGEGCPGGALPRSCTTRLDSRATSSGQHQAGLAMNSPIRTAGAVPAALLVCVLALSGCTSSGDDSPAPSSANPASSGAPPSSIQTGDPMRTHDGTPISLTIGDRIVTGTLQDNPAARALAQQLPLTLTFDDFNSVEKIAPLPSPLPMTDMPPGADPEIGEIGFWAPGGELVLYYGDVGHWNGIARLGTFDDVAAIEEQTGPFTVTIAPA